VFGWNFDINVERATSGQHFDVKIARGGAACEACTATWNMATISAFAVGPRKITVNLDRVRRSQDLSDAN
jgi:recombinational DNA repair protein (RecF pathway)